MSLCFSQKRSKGSFRTLRCTSSHGNRLQILQEINDIKLNQQNQLYLERQWRYSFCCAVNLWVNKTKHFVNHFRVIDWSVSSLLGGLYASHFVACLKVALLIVIFQLLLYASQTLLSTLMQTCTYDILCILFAPWSAAMCNFYNYLISNYMKYTT